MNWYFYLLHSTCVDGEWACTKEVCDSECSVLVNSFYNTFDGHAFHTGGGTCSFVLMQITNGAQIVQDRSSCPDDATKVRIEHSMFRRFFTSKDSFFIRYNWAEGRKSYCQILGIHCEWFMQMIISMEFIHRSVLVIWSLTLVNIRSELPRICECWEIIGNSPNCRSLFIRTSL